MKIVDERIVAKRRAGVPGAELFPVVLQELAGDRCRWCVRFCGQGRYFRDDEEMRQCLFERFRVVLR